MNNLGMIIPLVIYLIFVFGAAFYAYQHRSKGDFLTEYYLGNRSMSGVVLAMTIAASYIGASSVVGGPGAAYRFGLGWVLLAMIQLPTVWLALGVLGKRMAILSRQTQAVTINDILLHRYQSKPLILLTSLGLLLAFFVMMVVQFIGGAILLETVLGVNYRLALLIFAVTVSLYTFIGGFRAVVLTDTLQGMVMIVGTIILLVAVIYTAGGVESAVSTLESIDPALVSPYGPNGMLSFQFMASFWVLVCFAVIGIPSTVVRSMAYKDSKALHRAMLVGTVVLGLIMLGMHLAGALGRAVIPDLDMSQTDRIIPTLMVQVLPPIVAGIFIATPMAAIMSTIDSQLIQSSSVFVKDLYLSVKPEAAKNQKRIASLSGYITLFISVLLFFAALNPPDMLVWMNIFALGGLQATFLWVVVLGLYWDKANAYGAIASIIVGVVSYVGLTAAGIKPFGFHAIVPSLSFGLIAFLIANKLGEHKYQQRQD